jgi:hypothetical protein
MRMERYKSAPTPLEIACESIQNPPQLWSKAARLLRRSGAVRQQPGTDMFHGASDSFSPRAVNVIGSAEPWRSNYSDRKTPTWRRSDLTRCETARRRDPLRRVPPLRLSAYLPEEEIVPATANAPMPSVSVRKRADPAKAPVPVAPLNRPVPPVIM